MKTLSKRSLKKRALLIAFAPMFCAISVLADSPSNSGSYIVRLNDREYFFVIRDNGFATTMGVDFKEVCVGGPIPSDGDWETLGNDNPSADDLFQGMTKGDDIEAYIYPASYFSPSNAL